MDFNIIAVDFDGTLCENKWPEIGEPNKELIAYLKKRQDAGDKLVLWTCRVGEILNNAVVWSAEHGLIFDSINGIYEIPVGATVMIIAKNATVTDFEIDGIKQNLGYEQTSMSFILERGNDLTISTIKTENKITAFAAISNIK